MQIIPPYGGIIFYKKLFLLRFEYDIIALYRILSKNAAWRRVI